jgi:cytochrome c oxidase assembly factor CtaG
VVVGLAATAIDIAGRLVQLVQLVPPEVEAEVDRVLFTVNATALTMPLVLLAWAYLAWTLIRGIDDSQRPVAATRSGAIAGWLAGAWLVTSLVALALQPLVTASISDAEGPTPASTILFAVSLAGVLSAVGSLAFLVRALSIGLASARAE